MKKIEERNVGIIGLGLMGGAIARALRGAVKTVRACDIDGKVLALAEEEGVIDDGFLDPSALFPVCDTVFLCLNPSISLDFMEKWMDFFAPDTLITDIAGVKTPIVRAVEKNLRADLDFIPGHPMAGSEKGGYAQSKFCDFTHKNYILTPLKRNKPENIAIIKEIIHKMGFGRVTETDAGDHDRKIAFTSQLCHVIAAALIDCEPDKTIARFGGGSFEDLTRIAVMNAPQWTELFLENKTELLPRISQFEKSLDKLKRLIADEEKIRLENCLSAVRERRAGMK
jgi:prephenate dehydrogenase